ncbi:MAG: DUF167 family protein [Elusimicrobia bacterium]|jgi:hypothetical protein|nr:DUF167 family protein [Elusimicrobiota bacterium]
MEKLLRVKVHPDSRENRIEEKGPAAYEAWVKAEAEQGKANAAVLALLAARLGIEAKRLRIIKGATAPSKIVQVLG